jgi:hypothetical protein
VKNPAEINRRIVIPVIMLIYGKSASLVTNNNSRIIIAVSDRIEITLIKE